MIKITVTGQTFDIRKSLNDAKFFWNPEKKRWSKRVSEAALNATLESIRPPYSLTKQLKVVVTLTSVDINNNRMREGEMRIKLKPVGEREGTDFLELFQDEVCGVQLSPINCAPSPLISEKKKERKIDEYFF